MKTDYQKQLDSLLAAIASQNTSEKKQTLLLHACCGPCSSYVIEYLAPYFDITIYYYNPNIFPPAEYQRRLSELEQFLTEFPAAKKVQLVKAPYNPEDYYEATQTRETLALQTEPERGERCRRCYELRMKKAYAYAVENNFAWYTTTLSISPFKDAEKINVIGKKLETDYFTAHPDTTVTRFLTSDFKKRNGFLRSLQLSAEYHLYRQQYCGCEYSFRNTPHKADV